jgi:hypothetical protein
MDDLYTQLKRDLEEIEVGIITMRAKIRSLIGLYQRSNHPRRTERVASLRQLLRALA